MYGVRRLTGKNAGIVVLAVTSVLLGGAYAVGQNRALPLATRAQAALSQIRGKLILAGLQHPAKVVRDPWGVAHIYAQNQHDLFFAQGFVAAQDRLFQMELWKRSGQGRLAEVLGPSALFRDIYARLLSYRGDMEAEYRSYSPDTREILQAFTDGINAYIAQRLAPNGPGLPLEFQLAGFKPEPWRPEDCLNRMAAFSMTGNAFAELAHAQAVAVAGAEKASQLFDFDPKVKLAPAPGIDLSDLSPGLLRNLVGSDSRMEFPTYYLEGSNNWTVAGRLTQTGKPLLANDPHRVLAVPSLRYMVHLVAPGWDVIGAGEPGLPGVALGHNQHIAWGFTIFGSDQQDLYLEELNPSAPLQYRTEQGWQPMQVERQTFKVRGGPDVSVDLQFTRHGPVLWRDGRRALALRWVGSEPGTAGYLGSLAVDRAHNWEQFSQAMARWKVPSENIVYADTAGNIGEYSVGLSPIRKNWKGLLPVPGVGGYEWAGFVPTDQLPHSYNPAPGFIATANNKMIPDDYPYNIAFEWYSRYRVQRINQVLEEAGRSGHKLTLEDFGRLQNDDLSLPARQLVQLLRQAAGGHPTPLQRLLLNWDGRLERDSAAAALYELYLQELTKAVAGRVAPPALRWLAEEWGPYQVLTVLANPTAEVFGPQAMAERNRLLEQCLQTAAARLSQLEGADPKKWSWGELHVMRFRHSLDRAPGAAALTDPPPIPRSGDGNTVGASGYEGDSFEQVAGASYRELLDPGDWDRSLAVNAPGQSGQPGSPHYSDLLPLWSQGHYFPLLYSPAAVQTHSTDILVLEP
jgi:penicillin amidase